MTLDELLVEWSYRTEKGYPDLGNPSDILILKEILEKLELPTDIFDEQEDEPQSEPQEEPTSEPDDTSITPQGKGSLVYDEVIKKTLGVDTIPRSKIFVGSSNFSKISFKIKISEGLPISG